MGPFDIHPGYDSFPSPFRKKLNKSEFIFTWEQLISKLYEKSFHQGELWRLRTKSSISAQGKPNPFINLGFALRISYDKLPTMALKFGSSSKSFMKMSLRMTKTESTILQKEK
jgi:hypothetical protein